MSTVTGFKKMNWFQKPSAWKAMEAQRARRRQMVEQFQESSAALVAGLSQAQSIQIQGVGDLAFQNAQTRLQARAKEIRGAADTQFARFDKMV